MSQAKGFTLIELVVVIVILAILAVTALPKFIDIQDDALLAKVKANQAALQAGVNLANMKWRIMGSPTSLAERNDIQLYSNSASGQIDINIHGFPVQSYSGGDTVLSTDSSVDCLSLWQALIEDGADKAAVDSSAEFIVLYEGSGECSYRLVEETTLGFLYSSITGEVTLL